MSLFNRLAKWFFADLPTPPTTVDLEYWVKPDKEGVALTIVTNIGRAHDLWPIAVYPDAQTIFYGADYDLTVMSAYGERAGVDYQLIWIKGSHYDKDALARLIADIDRSDFYVTKTTPPLMTDVSSLDPRSPVR